MTEKSYQNNPAVSDFNQPARVALEADRRTIER